ncbi:MAG: hypothetical protein PHN31_03090 [Candidatus Gracilibacteria bacterium]|nr:hypothetical protein [Candidatus Gracilibacteria bacterium]
MIDGVNVFLREIKSFSKDNVWIFFVLLFCLGVVYFTGKGDISSILWIFLANFLGNLFIMTMQNYYTNGKNKLGAINQLCSVIIFTLLSLYGFFFENQSQYLIWQIMYILSAGKVFVFYNFGKDFSFLNEKTFIFINFILFTLFILYISNVGFHILQGVGFSLITTGLVSVKDKVKYWLNVYGIGALTAGSLWGVVLSYLSGSLDGIAFGYFLLTGTVFVFYLKLLPKYLNLYNKNK